MEYYGDGGSDSPRGFGHKFTTTQRKVTQHTTTLMGNLYPFSQRYANSMNAVNCRFSHWFFQAFSSFSSSSSLHPSRVRIALTSSVHATATSLLSGSTTRLNSRQSISTAPPSRPSTPELRLGAFSRGGRTVGGSGVPELELELIRARRHICLGWKRHQTGM